ncbi:Uncharacterized protein YR821_3468 [Yersinia ruckeri]|uniref:Uncharacterized protein n=1 Tax=Yersinia ruckeri TaxID=29486 RepID=A0A0A8VLS9_YERRU|nr:Uncharacterized protein YR821_3468 [Yersinia ruckeri]CEK29298.1 hypothetical protein CSF007_18010 [Yersinia ruckeri]
MMIFNVLAIMSIAFALFLITTQPLLQVNIYYTNMFLLTDE